ncbi:Auxin efflux carrier component 5 [Cocos nucifera]|uniref:Auxin efflux carrier component 5 n=1 Tax=Cocos nucifera TaxID=13894 RepID=A0A8K0HZ84_COCNU|nr:Auxin efflux carrier component 5 [Cocos nucifera]
MIGWGDIYKVVVAMVPLYVALGLGYGSVRWWRIFTPEQCEAINRLVVNFSLPFFAFEFTVHIDPFAMNYRVIAADAISKVITVLVLAAWAKCSSKGSYCWSITSYSLCALTNTLVVGAPLLDAMYGRWAQDLVVQLAVVQSIVWVTFLLFMFELRKAGTLVPTVAAAASNINGGAVSTVELQTVKDVEGNTEVATRPSFWSLMKTVWLKLAFNPNFYASILGITWAFIAKRWQFEMPSIIEGSVLIMSKTGAGLAMFSMGPAAMAIGAMAVGLRGDLLRVSIILAALPQSISSFIFAREYGLHADVLSTAVIFGTLVSLPLLVAYYIALGFIN